MLIAPKVPAVIKNSKNQTIKNSENLENLIGKIVWQKLKLVN